MVIVKAFPPPPPFARFDIIHYDSTLGLRLTVPDPSIEFDLIREL